VNGSNVLFSDNLTIGYYSGMETYLNLNGMVGMPYTGLSSDGSNLFVWSQGEKFINIGGNSININIEGGSGTNFLDINTDYINLSDSTRMNTDVRLNGNNLIYGATGGDCLVRENGTGVWTRLGGSDDFVITGYGDTNFTYKIGYPFPSTMFNIDKDGDVFVNGNIDISENTFSNGTVKYFGDDSNQYVEWNNDNDLNMYHSGGTQSPLLNIVHERSAADVTIGSLYSVASRVSGLDIFHIDSSDDIIISANSGSGNIMLDGIVVFDDDVELGFGGGGSFRPYFKQYSYRDGNIQNLVFRKHNPGGFITAWNMRINDDNQNMDFIIDGDTKDDLFKMDASQDSIAVNYNLSIPYVEDGYDMSNYNGNVAINGTTGLIGTKLLDDSWYWR
jgi:hypothetical protein